MKYPDERPAGPVLDADSLRGTDRLTARSRDGDQSDGIGKRAPLGLPCHRHDPNLWFAETPQELEVAKSLCRPCSVRQACLAGALRRNEPYGVWGGEILVAGRVVPRKRPRGRPRKNAPARSGGPDLHARSGARRRTPGPLAEKLVDQ